MYKQNGHATSLGKMRQRVEGITKNYKKIKTNVAWEAGHEYDQMQAVTKIKFLKFISIPKF